MCRDWYSDLVGGKIGVDLNFTRNYMDIKHEFYLSLPGEVERGATHRFSTSRWWFARQQAKQTPLPGKHSKKHLKEQCRLNKKKFNEAFQQYKCLDVVVQTTIRQKNLKSLNLNFKFKVFIKSSLDCSFCYEAKQINYHI